MVQAKTFRDLVVWQMGHRLVLTVYECTAQFPRGEQFGLTSQLRRAAVSITPNIAEGFARKSYKEKERFYLIAHGSLAEVQNQLIVARDISYLSDATFSKIIELAEDVEKLLNSFIYKTRSLAN